MAGMRKEYVGEEWIVGRMDGMEERFAHGSLMNIGHWRGGDVALERR